MHRPREDRPSNFDGLAESLVSTGSQILVAMGTFDLTFYVVKMPSELLAHRRLDA
jgi:hypothetical protein